ADGSDVRHGARRDSCGGMAAPASWPVRSGYRTTPRSGRRRDAAPWAMVRGAAMRTQAAVLSAVGEPLMATEVDLAAPGAGEVLVRIEASGVCHSDWNAVTGASATPLPAVLGHEGSGIVEVVGASLPVFPPGAWVVVSGLPAWGPCGACQGGRPSLCEVATRDIAAGSLPAGGFRLSRDGQRLHPSSSLPTFARHAVVSARSC